MKFSEAFRINTTLCVCGEGGVRACVHVPMLFLLYNSIVVFAFWFKISSFRLVGVSG